MDVASTQGETSLHVSLMNLANVVPCACNTNIHVLDVMPETSTQLLDRF
jgi:hypothetical protein